MPAEHWLVLQALAASLHGEAVSLGFWHVPEPNGNASHHRFTAQLANEVSQLINARRARKGDDAIRRRRL